MGKAVSQAVVIQSLLRATFPELCLHCSERIAQDDLLCANCAAAGILRRPAPIADEDQIERKFSFLYEGPAKTLFSAAKFAERRRALEFFIREAGNDLRHLDGEGVLFLAVPSRRKFLRRLLVGSLPQAQIIFDAFRIKPERLATDANKFLGEAGRYRRIHESMSWNTPVMPPGKKYVICDDVSTTGATLSHAAHLLLENLKVERSQVTLWALMYRERHFRMPRQ